MAQPTLDELVTPLSRQDVEISIYRVMGMVGLRTSSWKPGAVVRAIVTGVAAVIAACSFVTAAVARMGFLELSSGSWLTLVARYGYGVTRLDATFAAGNVVINNLGGGLYTFDPGDLVVTNSITGKQYRNETSVTINPSATNVTVAVSAIEEGTNSSAFAGTITQFGASYPGLTVSNPVALIASDEESDAALIARCKNKIATLSPNAPAGAYEYWAKTATRSDGSQIGVNRVKVVPGPGDGSAYIYCSVSTGGVPGSTTDPSTDLGAVYQTLMLNVVPPGGTIHLASADPLPISISYDLYIYTTASKTQDEIKTAVQGALREFFPSRPIGGDRPVPSTGWVYRDGIIGAIRSAFPNDIFHVVLNVPAADVAISATQAPALGTVTPGTINQVAA